MSAPFSRSLRALQAEGTGGSPAVLAVAALLLLAWAGWALFGSVTVWAVTPTARVEVAAAAHPVTATESGRIVAMNLALGARVEAGDVLVELDRGLQEHAVAEARARSAGIAARLQALRAEKATAESLVGTARASSGAAVAEARARLAEAQATAKLADERLARLAGLAAGTQVSELELSQARAEAASARAAADALETAISREGLDRRSDEGDRQAQADEVALDIATLEAEDASTNAEIARLAESLERRTIRAPVAGRIGEVPTLAVGAFVQEGDRVATVVPDGDLRIVGSFEPFEALGRVRVGQAARVRLDGFPWTWYGTLPAQVSAVADEVRDGAVRVELAPTPGAESPIPLQHGLPGSVEVAVEEVSPATLLLRAAGQALQPRADPAAP